MPALDIDPSLLFGSDPEYNEGVVTGIFVGGCVDRGDGSSFRAMAHAHTSGGNLGWMCFRSAKRLLIGGKKAYEGPREAWRASRAAWHEYAHLRVLAGHVEPWRQEMRRLGQPLQGKYKGKFKRGPRKGQYKYRGRRAWDPVALVVCTRYLQPEKACVWGRSFTRSRDADLAAGRPCPRCGAETALCATTGYVTSAVPSSPR